MALAVGAALALLLGVCVRLAAANVMGIDLGSEFMKVRAAYTALHFTATSTGHGSACVHPSVDC